MIMGVVQKQLIYDERAGGWGRSRRRCLKSVARVVRRSPPDGTITATAYDCSGTGEFCITLQNSIVSIVNVTGE